MLRSAVPFFSGSGRWARNTNRTAAAQSTSQGRRYSVVSEADHRDDVWSLVGLPRLTVVLRDMDILPETDDDATARSIKVPCIDIVREPLRQTLFAPDKRRPEPGPIHGATFCEGTV